MACWIVLCGASSAGKTTLAEDWLKKHGEYAYLEEVARGVMEKNSIMREDVDASLKTKAKEVLIQLETLIFEEQNRQELAHANHEAVIVDRGPDPLAFLCQLKDQQAADDLSKTPAATACLERYRQPHCLMVVVGLLEDTVDDGFRRVQGREEQEKYTTILCRQLDKHNIPYHHLKETDRLKRVCELEKIVEGGISKFMLSHKL
jgi:nicotinamide riboside kinase